MNDDEYKKELLKYFKHFRKAQLSKNKGAQVSHFFRETKKEYIKSDKQDNIVQKITKKHKYDHQTLLNKLSEITLSMKKDLIKLKYDTIYDFINDDNISEYIEEVTSLEKAITNITKQLDDLKNSKRFNEEEFKNRLIDLKMNISIKILAYKNVVKNNKKEAKGYYEQYITLRNMYLEEEDNRTLLEYPTKKYLKFIDPSEYSSTEDNVEPEEEKKEVEETKQPDETKQAEEGNVKDYEKEIKQGLGELEEVDIKL